MRRFQDCGTLPLAADSIMGRNGKGRSVHWHTSVAGASTPGPTHTSAAGASTPGPTHTSAASAAADANAAAMRTELDELRQFREDVISLADALSERKSKVYTMISSGP